MSEQWYYNVKTGTVEYGKLSRSKDRLGPYPDEQTALRALEIVQQRNEDADASDEQWKKGSIVHDSAE